MACGNFCKNRKMRFLGLVSKFNFRSPVWQIFTIFSACFIYKILNTHKKIQVSQSKTVVTGEWSRQGSKFICLQNLRSKLYLTKIFLKILFGHISHLLCSDNAFQALKNFSASKQYLYSHQNMIATKIGFFAFRAHFGPLKLRYSQLLFYTFLHKIV